MLIAGSVCWWKGSSENVPDSGVRHPSVKVSGQQAGLPVSYHEQVVDRMPSIASQSMCTSVQGGASEEEAKMFWGYR